MSSVNPPGATLGLDVLNSANLNNLADALRYINGPNMALGDLLNALIDTANAAGTTQAVQTLTVAGTPASGNVLEAIVNGIPVTYTLTASDTTASAATGLLTNINASAASGTVTAASQSAGVVKLTAVALGVQANAQTLSAVAFGGGATLTASNPTFGGTAGGAPVTQGKGSIPRVAAGTVNI